MSGDLISRQDAVTAISDLLLIQLQGKRLPTWNEVYHAIDDIPSAESERKKGKWIYDTERVMGDGRINRQFHCSVCGDQEFTLYSYCPSCGADMR